MEREIVLCTGNAKTKHGVIIPVRLEIAYAGFCPDIYVHAPMNIEDMDLYDDKGFIADCINILRDNGYNGKDFGRAELGMQGSTYIVLEPSKDADGFLESKWSY